MVGGVVRRPFTDDVDGCLKSSQREQRETRIMLSRTISYAAALWTVVATDASATIRIADDGGGNIGAYYSRFASLRKSGEQVVIDGPCLSACTLIVGIVPRDRICVTPNAAFGFHAAYQPGALGEKVVNVPATRTLMSLYPPRIRGWIRHNGGLTTKMMYLSGPELTTMFRHCR
jgi:hypothetical protein